MLLIRVLGGGGGGCGGLCLENGVWVGGSGRQKVYAQLEPGTAPAAVGSTVEVSHALISMYNHQLRCGRVGSTKKIGAFVAGQDFES